MSKQESKDSKLLQNVMDMNQVKDFSDMEMDMNQQNGADDEQDEF